MGYACPVCGDPQADGEHLANHLAFSALLGHEDHEAWLDEQAPEWAEAEPETLAERVVPAAESVEYPGVDEDEEVDETHLEEPHAGERPDDLEATPGFGTHEAGRPDPSGGSEGAVGGDLDEEAREILEEARRLTEGGAEDDDE